MKESIAHQLLKQYKQNFYEFCGIINNNCIRESFEKGGKRYTFKDGSSLLANENEGSIVI